MLDLTRVLFHGLKRALSFKIHAALSTSRNPFVVEVAASLLLRKRWLAPFFLNEIKEVATR
ncbi:hypothetical protein [Alkalihalobacillus deserti]|uniref:hypothetical protein n=1 Tax=Alkalihalobacillus deserti TaxID=2879466 RepID=UPI001D159BFF|nr:hypothetical protein [Alkalihalobacillus deserti]